MMEQDEQPFVFKLSLKKLGNKIWLLSSTRILLDLWCFDGAPCVHLLISACFCLMNPKLKVFERNSS